MPEIVHIIIHENCVKDDAELGNKKAQEALAEIDKIKQEGILNTSYFEVSGNPQIIPVALPFPSKGLEILVSGGFKWQCLTRQLYWLRREGYIANFHGSASYDNGFTLPKDYIFEDLNEIVPEYYEQIQKK